MNNSLVKKLRQITGIGIMECKKALEEADGDFKKAQIILKEKGTQLAIQKQERKTQAGIIETYLHSDRRIGVILELSCETDFVAKNEEFINLAHELVLQIASMSPKDTEDLFEQSYIKDESKKVRDLIQEKIQKTGENIVVKRFCRYEIGK